MATQASNVILVQGGGRFGCSLVEKLSNVMPANTKLRCGYAKEHEKNAPALQKTGCECCRLDLEDENSINQSLKDVREVVLIPPFKANREELCKRFIDKALAAGVSRFILISVEGAPLGEFPWAKELNNIEQKLISSGITYTILRPSLHQETFNYQKDAIKDGKLCLPTGDAKFAPVCFKDVTELCVKLLTKPDIGKNKVWDVTGPSLYNGKELADLFTDVLRKQVTFVDMSTEEFKTKMQSMGLSEFKAQSLGDLLNWYRKGKAHRVITDYSVFLGRDPTMLRDHIAGCKTEFA